MPRAEEIISHSVLLPEIRATRAYRIRRYLQVFECEKARKGAVCGRCATLSQVVYDKRTVSLRDAPIRGRSVILRVLKRRYWCKPCKRPFTEPIDGVMPGRRTTQRYRRSLLWACENYADLKRVRRAFHCSNDLIYRALYEQLELRRRTRLYPWPKSIGIDEHAFRRYARYAPTTYATMIVDHKNRRVMEIVEGKTGDELRAALESIPGRENVQEVTLDMSDTYRSFVKDFFPNARIVADKFHVLRLLTPHINRVRKEITGDRRTLKIRRLLLRNGKNLDYWERLELKRWLDHHPRLEELYYWKEKLHSLYRIRGYARAETALAFMLDEMASSRAKEIKTLRRTLLRWRKEVLNYFVRRITNGRTEGFNNVAKVIKRRSYGFRNFQNYRLRVLNACA